MKRTFILIFFALVASSCERECEAFDKSREIAKWHLFPELNPTYTFVSEEETRVFNKVRSELSSFETIKCLNDCECIRHFSATYKDNFLDFQSGIVYDQDGEYTPKPIFYEIDYFEVEFDVTSSGEIIGMDEDSIPFNPGIDFENLDSITIGDTSYQKVLHLRILLDEIPQTELWIARGTGLVAFQEDSIFYIKN